MLFWRIASDILPTRENLSKFNNEMDIACPLCGCEKETTLHIFTGCSFSRALWFGGWWGSRVDRMIFGSPVHLVNFVMDPPLMNPLSVEHKETIIKVRAQILDIIWKWRNRAVHDGVIPNQDEMKEDFS
jgi:hypothetical protein